MRIRVRTSLSFYLCFTLLSVLYYTPITFAQEKDGEVRYQVIRLLSEEIVPSTAIIELGTVVIWVNENRQAAEIQFTNAQGMIISCDGADSYIADPQQIISARIPYAGLESLCLIQKGDFSYTVKRGLLELKGTIIVK